MSKKELVYNPKTGSFDKVTAKNSKKKSNEYNPKTGSFEREPQKKLKSKKKEKVDRSKKSQEVTKVLNSNFKSHSDSNIKKQEGEWDFIVYLDYLGLPRTDYLVNPSAFKSFVSTNFTTRARYFRCY